MSTWTWDSVLQWWLDYFNMMAHIPTWYLGSLAYFNIMVHTYPWNPGIGLSTLITSIEDNDFIRGMECSATREVMGGGWRGDDEGPIVIIVDAIQYKVE
jgi:hypothetical protein